MLCDDKERKSGHAGLHTSQSTRDRVTVREHSCINEAITGEARDSTIWSSSTLRWDPAAGVARSGVIQTFVRVVVFWSQDTAVDSVIGTEHREQFAVSIQNLPKH